MNLVTLKFKGPLLFSSVIGGTDSDSSCIYIFMVHLMLSVASNSIVLIVWLTVNKLLEKMKKEMVLAQFKSLLFYQYSVLIVSFIFH